MYVNVSKNFQIYGPGSRKLSREAEEMGPILRGGGIFGKTVSCDHLGGRKYTQLTGQVE